MPRNDNFEAPITADTLGAVWVPEVTGGRRGGVEGYWRMPTPQEKAASSLQAQMDALSPTIKAAIASGQLHPQYSTINIGGRNGDGPVNSGITGFTSNGPNDTYYTYDLAGNTTGQQQIQRGGGGWLDHFIGAISGGLADLDSSLKLSENAPIIAAIGIGVLTAGAGTALGTSMMNAGILTSAEAASAAVIASGGTAAAATAAGVAATATATAVGTAVVSAGVQVAQGKPLDQALGSAVTSLATSQLITPAIASEVKSVINSPLMANTVTNMGTSLATGVLTGKTEDQIAASVLQAGAGTVVHSVAADIVKNTPGLNDPSIPPEARRIALAGIAGALTTGDGTKSMVNAAISVGTKSLLDTASEALKPGVVSTLQNTYDTAAADNPEAASSAYEQFVSSAVPPEQDPEAEEPTTDAEPFDGVGPTKSPNEAVASGMSPGSVGAEQAAAGELTLEELGAAYGTDALAGYDEGPALEPVTVTAPRETPDELLPLEEMGETTSTPIPEVIADTPPPASVGTPPPVVKPPVVKPPVVKPPTVTSPASTTPAASTTPVADAYINKLVQAGPNFDFRDVFDPLGLEKARNQAKPTKIASGGYLDDLLADPTSFNDLLRTLRS